MVGTMLRICSSGQQSGGAPGVRRASEGWLLTMNISAKGLLKDLNDLPCSVSAGTSEKW